MIAKLDTDSITLQTRATPAVLAMVPRLEGRRTWLKGGGLKLERTEHNLQRLQDHFPNLVLEGITDSALFDVQSAKVPFAFKRQPDAHQLTALQKAEGQKVFGFFMEQGTGKTKVEIDRACQLFLEGKITGVLVVTKKGVHRQWIDSELPKDHGPPFKGDWWRGKELDPALLVQGGELKWWAVNYDALRGSKAFAMAKAFCQAHLGKLLIVADESQCIMNHTSERHKRMMELRGYASYADILTGTPQGKDLTDQWAQFKFLDPRILGCKYLTTFKAEYCIMGGFEGREIVGAKNLEQFQRKCEPYRYRVTKEEIGYIPKRYSEWTYDLTPEQRRLIMQVKQELLADLGDEQVINVSSATAAFTKVAQIANGFIIDEDGKVQLLMPWEKNPRIQACLEWLDSHEGKAVIWTRFIADRELLAEALKEGTAIYEGSNDHRHEAKRRFMEDPSCRIFLANPQSAGTGLDGLQTVCTQALYYSNGFNAIDRWQSEDRIDRRGSIGGSHYTDLIGRGSIDRYILRNLRKKKGLSQLSLGDIQDAFDEL